MTPIKKHLTRNGNSLAIILDKILLEMVGADKDAVFEVSVRGGAIVLRPIKTKDARGDAQ